MTMLDAVSAFATTLASHRATSEVLDELASHVGDVLGVSTGVSLVEDKVLRFVAGLDEIAGQLEQVQADEQEGPSLDAIRTARVVRVPEIGRTNGRWPGFSRQAKVLGVASAAVVPLTHARDPIATIGLYSLPPRQWSSSEVVAARVFADMATAYLANAGELARLRQTEAQLQEALQSRIIIEQAKGVIATQRHVGVSDAFDLIRGYARNHDATLRSVAHRVVHEGLRP